MDVNLPCNRAGIAFFGHNGLFLQFLQSYLQVFAEPNGTIGGRDGWH